MSGKTMCDIEDDVKDALRAFRFRKSQKNAALILKVDREKQKICIDEQMEDIKIDDLQEIIPCHQPRDIQMELQVIYAGMKLALQREAELTRVYEVRELEELTEDWLKEKLSR
ncbi:glia maturation factor beta isoform X2 [Orussus abietinus]|uniref:glia maturation factor beta isoform X2 n=1 Tax=Orussus abietinus TaxID=222816 RepID=UPI000624F382|nr:glia maturation factor beta isoform X2 [Orussus abietinus]